VKRPANVQNSNNNLSNSSEDSVDEAPAREQVLLREENNTLSSASACLGCCRYLAKDENIATILRQANEGEGADSAACEKQGACPFSELRLLDLSAGAGLLAISFAKAGAANAAASDIPAQLPQLEENVERAGLAVRRWPSSSSTAAEDEKAPPKRLCGPGGITVVPLYWGEPLEGLKESMTDKPIEAAPPCDITVASDILFIALRDGRTKELAYTLKNLLLKGVTKAILFAFEERLWREEDEWMREVMGLGFEPPSSPSGSAATAEDDRHLFRVTELKGDDVTLTFEESLASKGAGAPDSEIFNPFLFWECPPVRMFIITLRKPLGDANE
jgi:hypothetical protein